jgi:MFS family permease
MSANNIIEEEETSAIVANHIVAHAEHLDNKDQMDTISRDATASKNNRTPGHPDTSSSSSSSSSDSEDNDDLDNSNPLKFEYQALSWRQRPSHITMRVAMVVQIIGIMSAVTSQLDVIVYLICQSHYNQSEPLAPLFSDAFSLAAGNNTVDRRQSFQDPRCFSTDVSALVSIFQTYMTTVTAILGVMTVPILASLSDRFGRKPIFIWTMSCSVLSLLITIACCTLPVNYRLFLVASVIDGFGGSMFLMVILCCSYTSDCVREQFRAGALSVLDAFVFGGIALGPFFGSLILKASGHDLITLFLFSLACQVIALTIVIFSLNESRSEKERVKSQGEHLNRKNSFLDERRRRRFSAHSASFANLDDASTAEQTFEPELTFNWSLEYFIEKAREIVHNADILGPLRALNFTHLQDRRARINAYILVFVQATLSEVIIALMPLVFLYAKTRFGWTSVENGYFISLIGGARFVVLSTLLPFVINFCRKRWSHLPDGVDVLDKRLLQGGLLFSIAGHLLMAESPTGTLFMSAVCVIAFGSGSSPLLRNAVIKHSPPDRIGEVLGAASLISRLQNTIIPALFATVYSLTVKHRPQAIIELVCAVEGLMFVLISGLYLQGPIALAGVDELVNQQA